MNVYDFGPFRLDAANHQLTHEGRPLPLKPKAFDTLLLLVRNSGRVLSKEELLHEVWPGTFVEEASLTQNIYELRKVLSVANDGRSYIENVPRRGYRFVAEVTRVPDAGAMPQSLAVLPFRQLGGEPAPHLAAGIADAIASALASLRTIRVRPASATAKYAASDRDALAAARELIVTHIVDGAIQVVGESIRVTAELVDVTARSLLWSERFDGTTADLFALQDAISDRVAHALRPPETPAEAFRPTRQQTSNGEAYQLYLKGRYNWTKGTPEGLWKALEFFHAAIEADPGYALAWVGIADSYTSLDWYGVLSSRESNPKAIAAAARALAIDDSLAEAHASLAMAKQYAWEWDEAEREYRIALAQDPSYAQAHQWYGVFLAFLGRFDEAIRHVRIAEELDPASVSISAQVALVLLCARRYDEALAQLEETLALEHDSLEARFYLALTLDLCDRWPEAIAVYRALPAENPDFLAGLAHALGRSGAQAEAQALIRTLTSGFSNERTSYVPPFWLAIAQLGLPDVDGALASLERAVEDPDDSLIGIGVFPQLDPIREHPRFRAVLHRMKLA